MSDLNWCTFCDNAISPFSKSLYCSDHCLRADALRNHPLLGYTYPECIHFARRSTHIYHAPPKSGNTSRQFTSLPANNRHQPSFSLRVPSPIPNISAIDNSKTKCQGTATKLVRLYAN